MCITKISSIAKYSLICEVDFIQVIAEHLSIDEVEFIRKMFRTIDTDNNGKVTFEELKVGLINTNSQLTESEMELLMEAVNLYYSILTV